MKEEKLVLVKYYNPERNAIEQGPGWLREGIRHLLLIQERIEGVDLYTYTAIPKHLIRTIYELKKE